ncbi:MAG: two-component system sensor histidine kinase NtrB [Bdellovibrionales bacterium]
METKLTEGLTSADYRGLNRILETVRPLLFVGLLLIGVIGLVVNQQFQSQKISLTWFLISLLGLGLHFTFLILDLSNEKIRRFLATGTSFLLCVLFYQMQSTQSLYLILLLLNILISGLQDGSKTSTEVALFSSLCFSFVIILSPTFSHFQDLLSLGLFNFSAFMTAALSGLYFEKLSYTQKAYDESLDQFLDLNSRHRVLIEELPLGVLVMSEMGDILEKNPIFEKLYEKDLDLKYLFSRIREEKTDQFTYRVKLADQVKDYIIRSRRLEFSSRTYWMMLIEDVTQARRMEEDLKQKEKLAAIGTLAAGIAHEIRNPLAGMSGSVELLSLKPNTEEDQKLFKIILREIDRLNRLITEFLDFSRPSAPVSDKVSLTQTVQLVLSSIEMSKDKPAKLSLETQVLPEAYILGSADKLKQALLNIIINSLQAMKDVEKPSLKITLKNGLQARTWELIIEDNGMGMSETTRTKMFEPFHTTKPKGTGLGLAITHKILEAHHAQVVVSSEVGKGTVFSLIFPCA